MYRIITEHKNLEGIKKIILDRGIDFSYYLCHGYWKGQEEQSLIIEIDDSLPPTLTFLDVAAIARTIKIFNNQEAVLIQQVSTASSLV